MVMKTDTLKGAQRQVHLIDSPIRSFLMANILPDHFFVATYRRDKIAPVQKCCPTKFRFLSEYRPLGRLLRSFRRSRPSRRLTFTPSDFD